MSVAPEKSDASAFFAGCLGGFLSTLALQPLDVVKTQLQTELIHRKRHPGLVHVIRCIASGAARPQSKHLPVLNVFNFWVGTVPSLWRCVPGVGCYFLCLNSLERFTSGFTSESEVVGHVHKFFVGFCARSFVTALLSPLILVKTQFESGLFGYSSMSHALISIHKRARWRGLYSGVLPTIFRDAPYSGLYFMVYGALKKLFVSDSSGNLHVAFCAATTATICTSITQPADVLRAYRQLLLANHSQQSTSSWLQVFRTVLRTDGLSGLWCGLTPRLVRRGGMAVITWTLYERIGLSV